jgi:hypothetical protein
MANELNELMRDFNKWDAENPLPIGDPTSGAYAPTKKDLRDWATAIQLETEAGSLLNTKIVNESATRLAADNAEASARIAGDNAEANARVAGLNSLDDRIDAISTGERRRGSWSPATPFPGGAGVIAGDWWEASAAGTRDGLTFAIGDGVQALIATPSTTVAAGNWDKKRLSSIVARVFDSPIALAASLDPARGLAAYWQTKQGDSYIEVDENPTLTTGAGVKLYAQPKSARYTPREFGGDPTGNAGSSAAINRAMLACAEDKKIMLLEGEYLCDAQIKHRTGVVMEGATAGGSLLKKGFNGDLMEYASDLGMANIRLDGQKALYTGGLLVPPVAATTIRSLSFEKVDFFNFAGIGMVQKEHGQATFDTVRWLEGDGPAIVEDGYYDVFPYIDSPRYTQYRSCEVRSCLHAVHSIKGSRDNEYDIRIQQCLSHAYFIEGNHFSNRYYSGIGSNDGSAFYIGPNGDLNRALIMARLGSNLQNPPSGDYVGEPADIYFAGTTGTNLITLMNMTFGNVPAGQRDIKSRGKEIRIQSVNSTLSRSVEGKVSILELDGLNSPSFDWSTAYAGLSIDFAQGGAQPGALIDRKSGDYAFFTKKVRAYTASATILAWEDYVRASAGGGAFILTLPDTSDAKTKNKIITVKKVDGTGNVVTIVGTSGQTINGAANLKLSTPNEVVTLRESLGLWEVISTTNKAVRTTQFLGVNGTIAPGDGIIRAVTTSSSVTLTLPALADAAGRSFVIYKQGSANTVTVTAPAGATINGASTFVMSAAWEVLTVYCDGTNYVAK